MFSRQRIEWILYYKNWFVLTVWKWEKTCYYKKKRKNQECNAEKTNLSEMIEEYQKKVFKKICLKINT